MESASNSKSALLATTKAGLSRKSGLYINNSLLRISNVVQGYSSDKSKTKIKTLVLSICLKKSSPKPLF